MQGGGLQKKAIFAYCLTIVPGILNKGVGDREFFKRFVSACGNSE
jgi:hypothetical protein